MYTNKTATELFTQFNWKLLRVANFKSFIDNNDCHTAVQKFHYLRAVLQGEAATVLQSSEGSAENYKIAWQLFVDRYKNKHYPTLLTNMFKLYLLLREMRGYQSVTSSYQVFN